MHNHRDEGDRMKGMMWMMIFCCALPILLILVFGAGGEAVGAPRWVIFGGIALMVMAHFFMMGGSRKHSDTEHGTTGEENIPNKNDKTHSGHRCCH